MANIGQERLMGWKAIGNFVGRDARTVRRWEAERGLPVNRVPGGGSASVWADVAELRAWMARDSTIQSDVIAAPKTLFGVRAGWVLAGIALVSAIAVPFAMSRRVPTVAAQAAAHAAPYGSDQQANDTYRAASYAMNTRSVAGLFDAAQKFGALATKHPGNARAYVGLAETNLLLREFNSIPEEIAYRRAGFAAQKALALDPNSPGALRSLAFVKYWSDGDRAAGLDLFRRAIAADPSDSQSHHWYGTALLGEGRYAEALKSINRARAFNPGSSAISADEAAARWVAGDHVSALASLRKITEIDPNFSGAHSYLARYYLLQKDDRAFLAEAAIAARLKRDADHSRVIASAATAYRTSGRAAMLASLIASAEQSFRQSGEGATAIAMLYAANGDRKQVLAWLTRAEAIREPSIRSLAAYPEFVSYRGDPAFKRFFAAR